MIVVGKFHQDRHSNIIRCPYKKLEPNDGERVRNFGSYASNSDYPLTNESNYRITRFIILGKKKKKTEHKNCQNPVPLLLFYC